LPNLERTALVLTKINSVADLAKLPHALRESLRAISNPTGHRHTANIAVANRKSNLQVQVVRAIQSGEISLELGVQILQSNKAYGPDGKKAIREA
jgi:hypothetical protein